MSFLLSGVTRLLATTPHKPSPPSPPDDDDQALPPRLRSIVSARYPSIPRHLDLAYHPDRDLERDADPCHTHPLSCPKLLRSQSFAVHRPDWRLDHGLDKQQHDEQQQLETDTQLKSPPDDNQVQHEEDTVASVGDFLAREFDVGNQWDPADDDQPLAHLDDWNEGDTTPSAHPDLDSDPVPIPEPVQLFESVLSREETPPEPTPPEETLVEAVSTQETAVEDAPLHEQAIEATPLREEAVEATPLPQTRVEPVLHEAVFEAAPFQITAVEVTSPQETAVEDTVLNEYAIEAAPLQETTIEPVLHEALFEAAPLQITAVEVTSPQETAVEDTVLNEEAVEAAPLQETAVEDTVLIKESVEATPLQENLVEVISVQETAVEPAPLRTYPAESLWPDEGHVDPDPPTETLSPDEGCVDSELQTENLSPDEGCVDPDLRAENLSPDEGCVDTGLPVETTVEAIPTSEENEPEIDDEPSGTESLSKEELIVQHMPSAPYPTPSAPSTTYVDYEPSDETCLSPTTEDGVRADGVAERLSAVTDVMLMNRAPQVIFFAASSVLEVWLERPPPPPVTLFLVSPGRETTALRRAVSLLPNNVNVHHMVQRSAWDADLVVHGFDWELPSTWVLDADVDATSLLPLIRALSTPKSTVIAVYASSTLAPDDFAHLATRRAFTVLSDRHAVSDLRVATLAHAGEHDDDSQQHESESSSTTTTEAAQRADDVEQHGEHEQQQQQQQHAVRFEISAGAIPHHRRQWASCAVVIGAAEALGCWNPARALRMHGSLNNNPESTTLAASVTFQPSDFPVEYKYAILNDEGYVVEWEQGENRIVHDVPSKAIAETWRAPW